MGTHRKPKARTTAFTAAVTAAIVVPAGTAAAATITGITPLRTAPQNLAGGQAYGSPTHTTFIPKTRKAKAAATDQDAESGLGGPILSANHKATAPLPASLGTGASASQAASTSTPPSAPSGAPASSSPSTTAQTPAAPYADAAIPTLEPTGLYGGQQYFAAGPDQWSNARAIVAVVEQRGMSPYAAVIAVATAMQESALTNLTAATNYDSLGLFQQRPSQGWGSAAEVTDPVYATNAFLSALQEYAPDYQTQALWQSAQAVQRSAYPTAYAQWEDQAARMVQAIMNGTAP